MSERLRPRDRAILATESLETPMHNATLEIFEPGEGGFGHAVVSEIVADRISYVPRYRQRLQGVPGGFANPVWVDDTEFDLAYHVRRSALPRPGTMTQLRELTARIVSRPLDRTRPLWEVYVIEGLEGGRVAVLSKSHQILVDGVETVDIGQVVLDADRGQGSLGHDDEWKPRKPPTPAGLLVDAITENLESPSALANSVRSNLEAVRRRAIQQIEGVNKVAGALTHRRSAHPSPLVGELSQQRRLITVVTDLADYRRIRRAHGTTVNDVVLAVVTGALRGWLMTRDEAMFGIRQVRALVPMSVIDDELEATSLGSQVVGIEVDLPIAEPSPVVRLLQVSYSLQGHRETGRAVSAQRLTGISGFAPTTFHALGSRVSLHERRQGYQVAVTNVPGPQFPLYAAGARMVESYPIHPLVPLHTLSIGVTSYDGQVFYGITADRDLVPDTDVFEACLVEALEELCDSVVDGRTRTPRVRRPRRTTQTGPRKTAVAKKAAAKRSGKRSTGSTSPDGGIDADDEETT